MRYFIGSLAGVLMLAVGSVADAQLLQVQRGSEQGDINAEVVMKEKAFHITKGETGNGFLLVAGTHAAIRLRNEDNVAHEFVSTLLYDLPFQILGNGTFVKPSKAAGIRVDPGQAVTLAFDVPTDGKDYQNLYEVFWCNIHGKEHGDKMRGEILIVDQRGETGGG